MVPDASRERCKSAADRSLASTGLKFLTDFRVIMEVFVARLAFASPRLCQTRGRTSFKKAPALAILTAVAKGRLRGDVCGINCCSLAARGIEVDSTWERKGTVMQCKCATLKLLAQHSCDLLLNRPH